jgi:outer membrane lipoprotein SlyB
MERSSLNYRLRNIIFLNKKSIFILSVLLAAALIGSCASSRSANVYSRDQAQQAQTVTTGVVTAVRSVLIEGTKTPAGVVAGGALGGIAGSAVGGGKGSALMTVVGAIAGGAAGAAAEEGITRKAGLEITVALDNGKTIAVVQEADQAFKAGDRVRVLSAPDGTSRVTY